MKLRKWQIQAREKVQTSRANGSDRVLIAVAPGAGKTHLAASLIADDLLAKIVTGVVIVVPSRAIKGQWVRALKEYGLGVVDDVDNATLTEYVARGMGVFDPARPIFVVTYQQVSATGAPDIFAVLCSRNKVFAVFDEIHHAADDGADFGESLLAGFDDATFKLSLSGTPFNTKGTRLAFCESDRVVDADGTVRNVTRADFTKSYGELLNADGNDDDPYVVRPVTFIRWNGEARWRYQHLADPEQFSERLVNGTRKTDSLVPLLDPDGESFHKMLRAALDELEDVRRHHANAGLLVTTMDADHCEHVAELIRKFGVSDVVIVRHDMPRALKVIDDFARGHQRALVAIKMVAEGVDITRLRVGLYASDTQTRMYFAQFTGRFLRWDKSLNASQFASIVIPEHVTLIQYALDIERMILDAAIQSTEGGGGTVPGPTRIVIDKCSNGQLNGAIQHGLPYEDQTEIEEVKAWIRRANVPFVSLAAAIPLWRNVRGRAPEPVRSQEQEPDESKRNDRLVGQIVMYGKRFNRSDLAYETVNAWANRQVGIPRKDKLTPIATLVHRREVLQRLLRSVVMPSDDSITL